MWLDFKELVDGKRKDKRKVEARALLDYMDSVQEFHLPSRDNGNSLKVLKSGNIVMKISFKKNFLGFMVRIAFWG